jgi:ketosteroid isomerase-like protein
MTGKLLTIPRALTRVGLIGCLLSSFVASSPFAQAKDPQHNRKHDDRRQVLELEDVWRDAQLNGDAAAMDKLLSDDYVGITMSGQVVTKIQQLQRIRSRQFQLTKIELSDVKVKLISNTAIVTSQAEVEGTNEGAPLHGTYRYTRVYTRLPSGTWKITNFEATRVGSPGGGRTQNKPLSPDNSSR